MKRLLLIILGFVVFLHFANGQNNPPNYDDAIGQQLTQNTITTAVPFLNIGPGARSGAARGGTLLRAHA